MKYYKGHIKEDSSENPLMKLDSEKSETFLPEITSQKPLPYSAIKDQEVIFQQGQFLEQYTIALNKTGDNNKTNEQAFVKVQFSPTLFSELIKFDVELNGVNIADGLNKDVTVNWRMYDGFDPKGEFYTDSNGLEMEKRVINHKQYLNNEFKVQDQRDSHIPRNYYPVDSAIAMRDSNGSNVQVTVMNDRSQGGSADLSEKATIELMQQRRHTTKDDQTGEPLNDLAPGGMNGAKVNA